VSKARLKPGSALLDDTRREGQIMRLVNHPSITAMYDLGEDDAAVYLVQELCEGGELFDRVVADGSVSDIKPENFLLTSDDDAAALKLCDFGLSAYVKPGERLQHVVGSAYYVAPEARVCVWCVRVCV